MDDMAVPQHHRSGAHRARRHPLLTALVTVGAVAVVSAALVWALLSLDVLGVGDDLREAGAALPGGEASASAAPSGAPSEAVPSAAPSAAPSAEPSPEPDPEPSVDRSLPVDVLNATGTSGLAAGAAEALGEDGWTVGAVGNYDGEEIPTAVLHPEGTDPATAAAVAADLGVGDVTESGDVDVLTVVLGPDYDG